MTILIIRPPGVFPSICSGYKTLDKSSPFLFLVSLMEFTPLTELLEREAIFLLLYRQISLTKLSLPGKALRTLVCIFTRMLICYYVSVHLLQGPSCWCSTMGQTTSATKTCTGGRDEKVSVHIWRSNALSAYKCVQMRAEYIQMRSNAPWVHTNAFKCALSAYKCVQMRTECIQMRWNALSAYKYA